MFFFMGLTFIDRNLSFGVISVAIWFYQSLIYLFLMFCFANNIFFPVINTDVTF